MVNDIDNLLKENEKLIHEKNELIIKLNEVNEIVEGIKRGNIDAIFIANNKSAEVLVSRTADQTYRRFIENMSEGVVTLLTDGVILYSNSSFAKMVDMPLEKVIGANVRELIPIEHSDLFERFFFGIPRVSGNVELSLSSHDGRCAHFIVSLNTLGLEDFMALNLVWVDVTDQKNAEDRLITINESLKRAIEERSLSEDKVGVLNIKLNENIKILKDANIELATFAHIASHDLQEPLRKILTYCNMLISENYDSIDQNGQSYLNKIQSASVRMRSLINDILEYSELSQNEIVFEPTSLQSVMNEIISDLEIVMDDTKAEVTITEELPVIEANPSQMRQLFQNIISNALKFIKPDIKPQIGITYGVINGKEIWKTDNMFEVKYCRIYIKDNGIGFKEQYDDKIFTIFQRLNNNSLYPGTGIGLAICKKIVEKHHGLISAESKLNEGALFTITLPIFQENSIRNREILDLTN